MVGELGAVSVNKSTTVIQTVSSGAIPTTALHFQLCDKDLAYALNKKWHSTLPEYKNYGTSRFAFAGFVDAIPCCAAIWAKPAARLLPQKTWLELRRLAVGPAAPRNTASRFIGWMVRYLRHNAPEIVRLISYQDTSVHSGTIYKAAGWTCQGKTRHGGGKGWENRPGRSLGHGYKSVKFRWDLILNGSLNHQTR